MVPHSKLIISLITNIFQEKEHIQELLRVGSTMAISSSQASNPDTPDGLGGTIIKCLLSSPCYNLTIVIQYYIDSIELERPEIIEMDGKG